jgi:putative ATPase
VAFEARRLHSMILWGPPGGRQDHAGAPDGRRRRARDFIVLSAVLAGVKDIREAVEQARGCARGQGRAHAWSSSTRCTASTRRSRMPSCRTWRSGLFTFIGATTENPSFEVNSALLSRATRATCCKPLDDDRHWRRLLGRARAAAAAPRRSTPAARERLVAYADGDARRLLNAYENVVAVRPAGPRCWTMRRWSSALGRSSCAATTRAATQFYDPISALHKSVRGSDPDAALYWLARMLDGGADPRYLARRAAAHGQRGHRPGRPAGAAAGAAMPPRSTSAWARPRANWRWRRPWSTWRWRRSPTPSTRPGTRRARLVAPRRHPPGARAAAQCTHAADEGTGLSAQATATPTTRPAASPRASATCPDGMAALRFYEPVQRGLEIRIGESCRLRAASAAEATGAATALGGGPGRRPADGPARGPARARQ